MTLLLQYLLYCGEPVPKRVWSKTQEEHDQRLGCIKTHVCVEEWTDVWCEWRVDDVVRTWNNDARKRCWGWFVNVLESCTKEFRQSHWRWNVRKSFEHEADSWVFYMTISLLIPLLNFGVREHGFCVLSRILINLFSVSCS